MAVLLDNFVTASSLMENEARDQLLRERKSLSQFKNPLEPLILRLASRPAAPPTRIPTPSPAPPSRTHARTPAAPGGKSMGRCSHGGDSTLTAPVTAATLTRRTCRRGCSRCLRS